jgi:2,3-dihydroxyphenylpropionate 1,2-dioxygenase
MFRTICLSHAPLIDWPTKNTEALAAKVKLDLALQALRDWLAAFDVQRIVIFAPDHITGLHMDCMPPFCVIGETTSINDFGGLPGKIRSSKDTAFALVDAVANEGVDLACTPVGRVDHGVTQPFKFLFGSLPSVEVVPILLNCHQLPIVHAGRAAQLGKAVGRYFKKQYQHDGKRTLYIGSGGLSHDPQFPQFDDANPVARYMVQHGKHANPLLNKIFLSVVKHKTIQFGRKFRTGIAGHTPLNPEWDKALLQQFVSGDLTPLHHWTHESIAPLGATGGQEIRTWLAALSAQAACSSTSRPYQAQIDFYEAVPEWGIGCGVLRAL